MAKYVLGCTGSAPAVEFSVRLSFGEVRAAVERARTEFTAEHIPSPRQVDVVLQGGLIGDYKNWRRASATQVAAVDPERFAGDEGRVLATQPADRVRHFLGCSVLLLLNSSNIGCISDAVSREAAKICDEFYDIP